MNWCYNFIDVAFLCFAIKIGYCINCQATGWEKVNGLRPETFRSSDIIHRALNSQGIVVTCFQRCQRNNCSAFIVDYARSTCISVEPDTQEFIQEPNIVFFQKVCVKVPESCRQNRLWQVERTLGAVLIDTARVWIPQIVTRNQCYEKCIQAGNRCKSAEFQTSTDLFVGDTVGRCGLSAVERGTAPQAYRASMYRDEYLQDQCHSILKSDYCSYGEYRNMSLPFSDFKVSGLSEKECEERCDMGTDGFLCRAYSVDHTNVQEPICFLHSDDTISLGVSALISMPRVVYKEREPCLDLKVQCNNSSLATITLTTNEPFDGRIYAYGYEETCGIDGQKKNVTTLRIPLPNKDDLPNNVIPCGWIPALSIDNENRTRTVVWATIIVQFNKIIQRLGDQAVRIGCSLGDSELPEPRNVSVHSSFSFLDPNAGVPPVVSTIIQNSTVTPIVSMRILDENNRDAVVTTLGQPLTLKIQIEPSDGMFDIAAGHLVASSDSDESSYLLLDEKGCPGDPATFPALLKDPTDNRSLIAHFAAFKFPESQVVRFNVIVRFCLESCPPVQCGDNRISYGRKRRSINSIFDNSTGRILETDSKDVSRNNTVTPELLPLEKLIYVQYPVVSPDPLLSKETPDTILIAGERPLEGLFCIDTGLLLGLLITWLIVQIVLTFVCLMAVHKYRKWAKEAEEERAHILTRQLYGIHGGNFEVSRRVRWADHGNDYSNGIMNSSISC